MTAHNLNLKNKTILLVISHEINYSLIKYLLEDTLVNLIWETNWEKSIELCGKNKTIDLVLMDIEIHNMNGLEAIRKISELNIKLPIIGLIDHDLKLELKNKGLIKFITKPILITEFLPTIELIFLDN